MWVTMKANHTTVTIPEAAELLGVSRNLAYTLARQGELAGIPVLRLGRRMVLPRARLEAQLGLRPALGLDSEQEGTNAQPTKP